jgi:hypothetical protein
MTMKGLVTPQRPALPRIDRSMFTPEDIERLVVRRQCSPCVDRRRDF